MKKLSSLIFSVICGLLCIGAIFMSGHNQRTNVEFGLGDFSELSLSEVEQVFLQDPSTKNLMTLLEVLCFQRVVEENVTIEEKIADYGTLLYDRARAGEVDLSTLRPDAYMSELLSWIRFYGAE